MTFQQSIVICFRKYFTFSGRATRPEYWWFFLFIFLCNLVLGIFDAILFSSETLPVEVTESDELSPHDDESGPLVSLFSLATFLPMLAVGWRRMHDTGRSGLYLFYPLIAMIGLGLFVWAFGGEALASGDPASLFQGLFGVVVALALVVIAISPFIVLWWLTRPSQPGQNQYGPNPHEVQP